jgi:hypothetical protein
MNPFGWSDEYYAKSVELLGPGVAYDIETIINCFTLTAESLDRDDRHTWEISDRRNDSAALMQWFNMLNRDQVLMYGFNNLHFDYPIIHAIFMSGGTMSAADIYVLAQRIINGSDRFGMMVWPDQRFAPQVDLLKVHHFDNKAKSQSLKGLEFNMRSASVLDMPVPHDKPINVADTDAFLVPYNGWDVGETKRFALISAEAIAFRRDMSKTIKGDVINFNDTKIGKELVIQRLGDDVCFTWSPRKQPRQTIRESIALTDVVFPYISFEHPEFNRVLHWMTQQTLRPADWQELDGQPYTGNQRVSTKGVFNDVHAVINGFRFDFGTGGIHGSVSNQRWSEDDEYAIEDIDVEALYPSIAIKNRLYPEHLGERFVEIYSELPAERVRVGKKSSAGQGLKLGSNGTYGDSNNEYSPLYDPLFTMRITINGQLMLCMLAERLMRVPTLQMIQINTDGMTYRVHRSMLPVCHNIQAQWEAFTLLKLERAYYRRMWIRDVNNYVAQGTDKKLKLKGAYWYADGTQYDGGWTEAISKAGPSAWHKDLSAHVVQRAAVAAMVHGLDPKLFLRLWRDPFDFMLRAKAPRGAQLLIGSREVQRVTRYFITSQGEALRKIAPPTGPIGQYKRKSGVSEFEYQQWHSAHGNTWSPNVHTKNQSVYEMVESTINAGFNVSECNRASDFSFDRLNYDWYEQEARKLIIG